MLKPLSASGAEPVMVLDAGAAWFSLADYWLRLVGLVAAEARRLRPLELPKCCAECWVKFPAAVVAPFAWPMLWRRSWF